MKRLIVCYDGTWNTADNGGSPTNVVRMAHMIAPVATDGINQIVYYDPGVGTGNAVDRLLGGAFGNGLESHIKSGYLFLAQNFELGDEIYIFGFSRGAFTARSLGGFIGACRGLLLRDKLHKLEIAWDFYRTPLAERNGFMLHNEIQANVRTDVKIKVLGVWDTVGALGIPAGPFHFLNRRRYSFHDTKLSGIVMNALQALAIDEKRGPFEATLWAKPDEPIQDQVVEQVWFAGVHADIGGSYNNSELSDLSLRWMMGRICANTGLQFDNDRVDYFLPENKLSKAEPADVEPGKHRIEKKSMGELHDSLGWYFISRLRPMMRQVGCQKARMGNGPFKWLYRISKSASKTPFCEYIHWSAIERHGQATQHQLQNYDPPNLRVALDDLKTFTYDQELQKGLHWAIEN